MTKLQQMQQYAKMIVAILGGMLTSATSLVDLPVLARVIIAVILGGLTVFGVYKVPNANSDPATDPEYSPDEPSEPGPANAGL